MNEIEQAPTIEQPKNWSELAKQAFGNEFHGEVQEAIPQEPTPEPVAESESEPVETEAQPVESEAPEVEEVPISSIEQLIEANEFDPEWFESLSIPVKVNGQVSSAKLSELKNSFQIQQAAEARLAEAKEFAKSQHQEIEQRRGQIEQELNIAAALITQAETILQGDVSKIDWDKLRVNDPAEFSAKQVEYSQRMAQINAAKQQALQQYQAAKAQQDAEAKRLESERVNAESQKLFEKIHEWKDPETAKAEKAAVAEYLLGLGFSKDEIGTISDHRLILAARKAMQFDKGQNKAEVAKKKVLTIPKVLKPGASKTPEQSKQIKLMDATKKLRTSGSIDDAVALLRSRRG